MAVAQVAAVPFQFQLIAQTPGPVSPAALVPYKGKHYWLAKDGAIYAFDGARVEAVGTRLATTFRDNFDWANRAQSHGWIVANPEPEVWFMFPSNGTTITTAISLNLTTGAMNPHTFAHSISASTEWLAQSEVTWQDLTGTWNTLSATYATWDSMPSEYRPTAALGQTTGEVQQFGTTQTDAGTAIAWSFTHPWKAIGGLGFRAFIDGIVSYWKDVDTSLTVTVGLTVTNSLGDEDTESTSTFDMATDQEHLVTFTGLRGQWARLRHAATSSLNGIEHRGAAIMGWKRGLV